MQLSGNAMCFACGEKNPIGLKLKFTAEGEDFLSELKLEEHHQGYAGIAHGGIITTALDEIMARLLLARGYNAITARLEVRFKKPVRVGEKIQLRARFVAARGKLLETEAQARDEKSNVIAEAKATSMCV